MMSGACVMSGALMRLQFDEWGICDGRSTGEAAVCCQGCPCFAYGVLALHKKVGNKHGLSFPRSRDGARQNDEWGAGRHCDGWDELDFGKRITCGHGPWLPGCCSGCCCEQQGVQA